MLKKMGKAKAVGKATAPGQTKKRAGFRRGALGKGNLGDSLARRPVAPAMAPKPAARPPTVRSTTTATKPPPVPMAHLDPSSAFMPQGGLAPQAPPIGKRRY